jgi:cyclopropane-fatty-acyl-phospholipid synthase
LSTQLINIFLNCQHQLITHIKYVTILEAGYRISEADGSEEMYDRIIFGIHAPEALKVLGAEATHEELRILGAFQYSQRYFGHYRVIPY